MVVSDGLLDAYDSVDAAVEAVAAAVVAHTSPQDACEAVLALASGDAVTDDVTAVMIHRRAAPAHWIAERA
jgi:serine/threonine protein phosphatase PrpC